MAWSTISALLLFGGALGASERIEAFEPHMGTTFRIVLYADDVVKGRDAIEAAFSRIAEIDRRLSDYNPESELNQICRTAVQHRVSISDDLYTVLSKGQLLAADSHGLFDLTVGPLVRLWREGRRKGVVPEQRQLRSARALTGYRKLHLSDHAVQLRAPFMQLDLGAIAKGYAADEALVVLRARGLGSALVAASGDVVMGDAPPGKAGWDIAIEGAPAQRSPVSLNNSAVSTSGDTEQFLDLRGVRYSHIVNPLTGTGLTKRIAVSVIAKHGIDSDALATAASVIAEAEGIDSARRFVASHGARAIVTVRE